MTSTNAKQARSRVYLDIGRFFFENAIPFNVARSPSFINMCRSIGSYGRGLKPPTMDELRTWILKEELDTSEEIVNDIKKTWAHTGVSILSDGWTDISGRTLINFLVNNPNGTVFLRCVDASEHVKDADLLFKLLDGIVEEVGEELVVQVVTDNASNYKAVGKILMEKRKHIYWTPCAAHCLDLMLEKIGELPQHKRAVLKAKKVSNFIYNHAWVLALMRKFTKREIIRPAVTRFATSVLTLRCMYELRQPLESMFTSQQWAGCKWANTSDGKEVRKIVLKDKTFWPSVSYALKTTESLVEVLRLVDSEKKPAMGYIYNAMDKAKEEIAKNLGGELAYYKEIWGIIDEKWEFQLHRPLHAAAYFLNPEFQYQDNFLFDAEVKAGLYSSMKKIIPNSNDFLTADLQLDDFRKKQGLFGYENAKRSVSKRSPVDWWINFGDEVPELQKFAIKVLGLTCSSSACERNWSTFNQVHTKKRNRLTTKKMNDLVYILYNKKLKDRHLKLQEVTEDPLVLDDIASDDEWVANPPNPNDIGEEIETSTLYQEEHNVICDSQGLEGGSGGGGGGARASGGASKRKMSKGKDKETRPMKKSKGKDKGKGVLIHEEEEEEFQDASSDDLDELDGLPIRFEDDSLDDEASDEDDIMDEDDY
ncbi:uncharacterized protein LOC119981502 isoform X1 [Tripterygium wilfordii]|uniref:uncharacterized protein LOC119981502 isoform X1 n=1 Tax=Tripterygium wilfordii TaxID=458696 RepID=UPI0018F8261D|nr:uncharacterized protein LOC119981502 isoform X1 [Tripterygium wilfordii]